ncbi:serine protease Do [Chromobacterium alkanivorans]|uniref:DegQ family serine endoprotease n=1 Tax=Chromobacterium TaxID=535 RepID=UPI0006531A6F|nr:DegQ family serine endoprotease [Chromobacterium sp. LK11]KMN82153.1 protease Do [Chromobacterium sp. LK11]MCS3804123.1 serine protease Do [Chromobacterium alkanivorans]MCS3818656.1 serine protease Do [Chromobacterium alkanivorans]MCS3873409.1 serine protease Do [Chromobacterium alkanivorans]
MTTYLRTLVGALLAASLLSGCDKVERFFKGNSQPAPVAIPAQQDGRVAMLLPDFTQLVSRDGPAVVNIQASREESGGAQASNLPIPVPEDDPLYDFFRRFIPNHPPQREQPQEESVSFGSGFIISADGYILTNAHVVADSQQVKVMLTDKRELRAKLVGVDKRTDVALLKVAAADLPVVKIGSPADLKVGEWVAAIGAPFGFDNTVTAGIVSAKGRSLPDENFVPFIQTDVAINPGNSGGPLFNLRGEVVGINSQIYSRSGGFMGISFAIPIDLAMSVVDQLKAKGKVSRGQLGINIQEVTQELAQSFGLQRPSGALVVRVDPKGPAARAGLQAGDIILKLDGKAIESSKDLPVLVGSLQPGTKIKLTVWRKGVEKELEATLAELAQDAPSAQPQQEESSPQGFQFGKLGLTLSELTANQRSELGVRGGLLIQKAQGPAARSGLQAGDVILGLNQVEVSTIASFEKALASAKGHIALLVRRNEAVLFVPLRLE